ncbi:MAG: DUF1294 domain-containing protein [Clostridiales bacterium]|nr:DUF1294 domain-containing protein [Clostridiales bacterium]
MSSFENSPQILAVKAFLRGFFLSVLDTVRGSFTAFYEWLRNVPIPVPPTMLKLFSNNKANFFIFCLVVIYVLYINIKTFRLFAADKKYAVRNKERVPERVLFKNMWLGGATGASLAMWLYRHKTQHRNFVVTALGLLFVQLLMFSFVLGFLGFWAFF